MMGIVKVIAGGVVGAGVEISDPVPDGKLWRLISARIAFSTSANVASRRVTFIIDEVATSRIVWRASASLDQAASLTYTYQVAALGMSPGILDSVIDHYFIPIPPIVVRPGFRFRTLTVNLQANDQYAQAIYCVEEWPA
jgi:hypothetical protein